MRLSSYAKLLNATNKQIAEILAKNFMAKLKETPAAAMSSYCTECGKDTSLCWGWDHFVNERNAEVCGACVQRTLNKEAPMGDSFKERLAKCLDRYAGQGKYLVLRVDELWLALESHPINGDKSIDRIVRPNHDIIKYAHPSREWQLDDLVKQFEGWLDKLVSTPRIFTDEDGKKYEIREVEDK